MLHVAPRTYPKLERPRLLVVVLGHKPLFWLILERLQVGRGKGKELVHQEMERREDKLWGED